MNILLDSRKPFDRALADLQRSVAAHGFSVLHVHALSDTLASKGHPIVKQVAVMEVCNARIASQMLGLIFPGMMDEPGSTGGRTISPRPVFGPELRRRRSLQIFRRSSARSLRADDISARSVMNCVASSPSFATRYFLPVTLLSS